MPDNITRPSKQPEKNTAISQMVGKEKTKKQGKNGSKQKSIYLTDEHIKAIAIRAAFEGISKSIVIQQLIEKELQKELELVRREES